MLSVLLAELEAAGLEQAGRGLQTQSLPSLLRKLSGQVANACPDTMEQAGKRNKVEKGKTDADETHFASDNEKASAQAAVLPLPCCSGGRCSWLKRLRLRMLFAFHLRLPASCRRNGKHPRRSSRGRA